METILTCSEMKQLDQYTIASIGVPSPVLMERAALACVSSVKEACTLMGYHKYPRACRILCVCGSGNNGGDGIASARILRCAGFDASVYMAGSEAHYTKETSLQAEIAKRLGVPFAEDINGYSIIVDALFGVGLSRNIEGDYAKLIDRLNRLDAYKIAVDIPSGINGDTGQVMGAAVRCDETVTFAFRKAGHLLYPGRSYCGKVSCADIGIYEPADFSRNPCVKTITGEDKEQMQKRDPSGNKAVFGKVLVCGGSPGMCGAAYLCAEGVLRSGAGMAMIRTREENRIPLQTLLPEAMLSLDPSLEEDRRVFDWCDVVCLGCGMGRSEEAAMRAEWYLRECSLALKPLILDADGLNLLSEHPSWFRYLGPHVIMTPHPGEMQRISGISIGEMKKDPVASAVDFARRTGAVVVQKDACTVTAGSDGRVFINESGNSGMGTAGSGDTLCGIIGGLISACHSFVKTEEMVYYAAIGVYVHGLAGDEAASQKGEAGMTARDILHSVPRVLQKGKEKINN